MKINHKDDVYSTLAWFMFGDKRRGYTVWRLIHSKRIGEAIRKGMEKHYNDWANTYLYRR